MADFLKLVSLNRPSVELNKMSNQIYNTKEMTKIIANIIFEIDVAFALLVIKLTLPWSRTRY